MTDPEVRTRIQVCIDCADAEALAEFWARALTYERHFVGGWEHAIDPAGVGPVVWFQPVPETKAVKNRLHIDIWFDTKGAATRRRDELVDIGATAVRREHDFWLLLDPAGNEFCLCGAPVGGV
ncbi:MAG: hypothetical protein DLM58_03240 [Pseudonocardiales bacterium]|nr:MAG: hypothetical protein DLM58_03240 [Pseudonocardiales bacterium]